MTSWIPTSKNDMRHFILALTFICCISCHDDEIKSIEKCSFTNLNRIQNLKSGGFGMDTVRINFKGIDYELRTLSGNITEKFYDYKLNRKKIIFSTDNENLKCTITLYYPRDSSYFNNSDYLSTFKIRDSGTPWDRTADSLVFVNQCSFNLYIDVSTISGETFKSLDRDLSPSNFFQIDSLRYLPSINIEVAHFKLYGRFATTALNEITKDEQNIKGTILMQFNTKRQ